MTGGYLLVIISVLLFWCLFVCLFVKIYAKRSTTVASYGKFAENKLFFHPHSLCHRLCNQNDIRVVQKNKHPMGCEAQLSGQCLFTPNLWRVTLTSKVGQIGLVLLRNHVSVVSLCMQDYKSLCAADDLCHSSKHPYTRRHTDSLLTSLYE